jgi:hypothetical protein
MINETYNVNLPNRQEKLFEKISNLSRDEAILLLKLLCKNDDVAQSIEDLSTAALKSVTSEEIAAEIFSTLNCINVFDLWGQSGETYYGYCEPDEKAYEMVQDVIAPYENKMKKYAKMNMVEEEKICCIGIIQGLLKYDSEGNNEFYDWCTDAMTDIASDQIYEWARTKSVEEAEEIQSIYDNYFE